MTDIPIEREHTPCLLGAFKDKIENEVVKNLEALPVQKALAAKKAAAKKKA